MFQTNLRGTFTLLEAARRHHIPRFLHVSTDEVYGSLEARSKPREFPAQPEQPVFGLQSRLRSAGALLLRHYKLPVIITRASNNYGPYQFPEKLIPLMISNALDDQPLPVYGDGQQVRDWLYVDDHCRGILAVLEHGREGEIYNIGGNRSLPNLEVVHKMSEADRQAGEPDPIGEGPPGPRPPLCSFERKADARNRLGARDEFRDGLAGTIDWYRANAAWVARVRSGEYRLLRAELREPDGNAIAGYW